MAQKQINSPAYELRRRITHTVEELIAGGMVSVPLIELVRMVDTEGLDIPDKIFGSAFVVLAETVSERLHFPIT